MHNTIKFVYNMYYIEYTEDNIMANHPFYLS